MDTDLGKVYLASRYSRAPEMQGVRDVLTTLLPNSHVTSRWIDRHGGDLTDSFTTEKLNSDPDYCSPIAQADIDDLQAADTLISFTGHGGKGGRHVEFGLGVALRLRLIIVGPREHVFHTLPIVEHFDAWSDLVRAISAAHPAVAR